MGSAAKLKYRIEVEVRRRLVDGEDVDTVTKSMGVPRSSVAAINREILDTLRRTMSQEVEDCAKAVLDAAACWSDADDMPIGSSGVVECRYCRTTSRYDANWRPSKHHHKPSCIVPRSRKIVEIIRKSFG